MKFKIFSIQLEVACKAYHQENLEDDGDADDDVDGDDDCGVSPKDVGHNIYILIHQLALYSKELGELLQPDLSDAPMDPKVMEALSYYRSHTAQIEVVRQDHNLEQIVFPIPEICEYLTDITKIEVREHSEVDEQGSKVTDFFLKTEEMYEEMKWQKKLRSSPALFWVSRKAMQWKHITQICSLFINLILACYYPYKYDELSSKSSKFDGCLAIILQYSLHETFSYPSW